MGFLQVDNQVWDDEDSDEDVTSIGSLDQAQGREATQDGGLGDELELTGGVVLHEDEDGGPDVTDDVARVANDIWEKGRKAQTMKSLFEKYPRPGNVACQKVDLNEEVISAILKFARARDLRLRAVQGMIARACVPAVRMVDALYKKDTKLSAQEHVNWLCIHGGSCQ